MAIGKIDTENKTAIKCKEICFQNNSILVLFSEEQEQEEEKFDAQRKYGISHLKPGPGEF